MQQPLFLAHSLHRDFVRMVFFIFTLESPALQGTAEIDIGYPILFLPKLPIKRPNMDKIGTGSTDLY